MNVKSLVTGMFITSCVVLLSLWMNSLVNSSVVEINFTPQRTATGRVTSPRIDDSAAVTTASSSVAILTSPRTFSNRSYVWTNPRSDETANMTNLVNRELSEYSAEYLAKIGLNQVILVDDIRNRAGQPVLGFSDPLAGEIYLNTVALEGEYSRATVAEQTIHHEVAHFLAYTVYGYWFDRDSGWKDLDSNYSYGEDVAVSKEYFPRDGFVSRYSMSSPGEDFAETYSLLYTEYFNDALADEASSSELLSKKLEFVYQTISQVE